MDVNVRLNFMLKLSVIVLSSAGLIGCGVIPKKPTSSYGIQRFAVPEVAEKPLKFNLKAGAAEMYKVMLPATENDTPEFNCDRDGTCYANDPDFMYADVSVIKGISLNYNTQLNRIGAIWQFYGASSDQAKAGNFSQAIVVGFSRDKDSNELPEIADSDPTVFNARAWSQSTSSVDIGWVGGYRLSDDWLVYGGPFVNYHDIDSSIHFEKRNNYDVFTMQQGYGLKGRQVGANIALRYDILSWLNVDVEFVSARYTMNNVSNRDSQFNFIIGTRF